MVVGGQCRGQAALPPGKRPNIPCTGGWVGPRAVCMGVENLNPTRTSSPDNPALASNCTKYTIPAHSSSVRVNAVVYDTI
jgi:hypothetical protein